MKIHFSIEVIFFGPHVALTHVEGIVLIEEILFLMLYGSLFLFLYPISGDQALPCILNSTS
jgi:hypothetical protein